METISLFFESHYPFATHLFPYLLLALTVWDLIWKGFGLWFSARNHQKFWFIAILILNTAGLLPIVYLIWFRRDKRPGATQSLFNNPLPEPSDEPEVA